MGQNGKIRIRDILTKKTLAYFIMVIISLVVAFIFHSISLNNFDEELRMLLSFFLTFLFAGLTVIHFVGDLIKFRFRVVTWIFFSVFIMGVSMTAFIYFIENGLLRYSYPLIRPISSFIPDQLLFIVSVSTTIVATVFLIVSGIRDIIKRSFHRTGSTPESNSVVNIYRVI